MLVSGGALLGGVALFLLTRAAVVRARRGHRAVTLHPVEVAYLADGPEHAVLVAAVGLNGAGVLRPASPPRLGPTGSRPEGVRLTREELMRLAPASCSVVGTATPDLPLERAVVRALAAEPGRPVTNKALRTGPEMTELRERLTKLGLIVDSRMARQVRLSGLWPIVAVALSLVLPGTGLQGAAAYLWIGAAVVVSAVGICWRVPSQTPAARRAVERAATHRHDLAERLTRRIEAAGFGTDNPELREAGLDPMVVAAHGPVVLWSAHPFLAVALGTAPSPKRRRRGKLVDAPLHHSPYVDYAVISTGGLP